VCFSFLTLGLWSNKTSNFYIIGYIFYPYFLIIFSTFLPPPPPQTKSKTKNCFYSSFSFFTPTIWHEMPTFFRTRKYGVEQKCDWNLAVLWLFRAIFAWYLNYLDKSVPCTPILSTGNISSLFLCSWLLDKMTWVQNGLVKFGGGDGILKTIYLLHNDTIVSRGLQKNNLKNW